MKENNNNTCGVYKYYASVSKYFVVYDCSLHGSHLEIDFWCSLFELDERKYTNWFMLYDPKPTQRR